MNKKVVGGSVLTAVFVAALYGVYLGSGTNQVVKTTAAMSVSEQQASCGADLASNVQTCVTFFNDTLPPYFVNLKAGAPWPVPSLPREKLADLHRETNQKVEAWNSSPSAKTKLVLKDIPSITNNYPPQ